jgi:hypothetical protein
LVKREAGNSHIFENFDAVLDVTRIYSGLYYCSSTGSSQ